jgi:hypothetical protein
MSYNNGLGFGYDQFYTEPEFHTYPHNDLFPVASAVRQHAVAEFAEFNAPMSSAEQTSSEMDALVNKIKMLDALETHKVGEYHGGLDNLDNLSGVLNEPVHNPNRYSRRNDISELHKNLLELKKKNEMLTMFIIILVVFIVVQYSSAMPGYNMFSVNSTPTTQITAPISNVALTPAQSTT